MKKICAMLMILAITLTLFACFPNKTPEGSGTGSGSSQSGSNADSGSNSNNNTNNDGTLPSNPFDSPLDLPIIPAA